MEGKGGETGFCWDEAIDTEGSASHIRSIVQTVQEFISAGASVLEVGPGTGGTAAELASLGYHVDVVDLFNNPLKATLSSLNFRGDGLEVGAVRGDGFRLPFADESFDLVYHQGLLEHFTHPHGLELLAENARVVQRGGYMLVDVPQPYSIQGIYKPLAAKVGAWEFGWERSVSYKELAGMIEPLGFEVVYHYYWGIIPPLPTEFRSHIKQALGRVCPSEDHRSMVSTVMDAKRDLDNRRSQLPFLNCVGILAKKN